MAEKAVFGIAKSESQAIAIADRLREAGFPKNDISVLFPKMQETTDFAQEQHTKVPEGAVAGAGSGAMLGGAFGWMVGIGTLAIPGLGPFIAAGPMMAALAGATLGADAGEVAGALIGMGIPEYEAKRYEVKVKDGNILMSVHTDDNKEQKRAKEIFVKLGAEDISSTGEASVLKHPASRHHMDAAEQHHEAAKHHHVAAIHHEAGDDSKAKEHAGKAREHDNAAVEHGKKAHEESHK